MPTSQRFIAAQALVLLSALSVASSWVLPTTTKVVIPNGNRHRRSMAATMDADISEAETWRQEEVTDTDFVICGGGPAGLLSAIMLAQKFPKVRCVITDSI